MIKKIIDMDCFYFLLLSLSIAWPGLGKVCVLAFPRRLGQAVLMICKFSENNLNQGAAIGKKYVFCDYLGNCQYVGRIFICTFATKCQTHKHFLKMTALRLYPVGIQTFERIVQENKLYIDKTEYVYRMTHDSGKYYFLSRPRRFGKSLLTSTLQSYFEGKKDLFRGLAIEKLETEWTAYPVLHLDLSGGKHLEKDELERYLLYILERNEKRFGIESDSTDTNIRLDNLITTVCQKTGRQVVVLIDEYDAPLLDVVHEEEKLPVLRNVMRNFYSPLKKCEPFLRFIFLTGITKFSQMSILSELNNLSNISMDDEYAGICGITQDELTTQMSADVEALGKKLGKTREQTLEALRQYYDGYHFADHSPDIYNPFSLLSAMAKGKLDYYWFSSGTPTYLIEMLRKFHTMPSEIGGCEADKSEFDAPTEQMPTIMPLLYQSGYITIKGHDPETDLYLLDIPNKEIRVGLYRCLLPHYIGANTLRGTTTIAKMSAAIRHDDIDTALEMLQAYLGTIPYCDNTHYEGHYQQMMYVIFSILDNYVDVEVHTPKGRVDMVLRTATHLYLFELKLDKSADAAMRQINLNDYASRFALCGLPIVKVGINFDVNQHTLTDWKVERQEDAVRAKRHA